MNRLFRLLNFVLFVLFIGLPTKGKSQYTMTNGGSVSTCSGTFTDPGGTGNYPGGQNSTITYTICSSNGDILKLDFTSFDLFSNGCIWGTSVDELDIYDGNSTAAPLLGSYTESGLQGVTIYGSSGCLTFQFIREDNGGLGCSDNNGAPGWSASISCVTQIPPSGDDCPSSAPFCSDISYNFPNNTGTSAPSGPNYGCLGSEPNPVWYYMKIGTSGPMQLDLAQYDNSNNGIDVDFAMWGPFTSVASGCSQIMGGGLAPLQCSYSMAATETIGLGMTGGVGTPGQSTPPNAVAGQYYIILITNYDGSAGHITLSQGAGTGQTDCSILTPCEITDVTATPGACNPADNSYSVTGQITFNDAPSTGTLIVEDCLGNSTTLNPPFNSPMSYTISGIPSNGSSCSVTAHFSDETSCTYTSSNYTAPSPCTPNCIITNFTTNIGACDPATNTFDLTGTVEFNDAPTTGQLIVEDCNGNNQTFNAPFTSPINYTISNIPSDGAACSITAHFTADASCTATQSYTNPADCTPPCHFDSLIGTIGACDGATNTFTLDGNVYFNHPPTTGTLTIENCDGYSQTFTAPFSSPQPFSISGIPADGAACTLTATFSADPACTISLNYSNPASCSCVATAGNYDVTVGGSGGLSGGVYHVCYGDDITIQNNGGYTAPNDIGGDPGIPVAYNPGIEYLIYSCPPTIFPPGDFTSDPCFTGYMIGNSGPGGGYILTNSTGNPPPVGTLTNNTFYIVPITMYDTVNGYYSYTNSGVPCYDMGSPIAVQYLPEVTSSNPTEDCNTGTFTVTISGGLPQIDGSSFTASNLTPATASFGNTTCGNNGTIQITGLQNGDMYSFDVADANGCPITISGGPFVGLPTANAGVDDTAACGVLTYTLSATPSVGTGTWTGPAGATFSNANSPTSTVTVPSAGTYTLTWTEDNSGGCTDNDQVTITFIANPTYTVNIDNANCGNSDGEIDLTAATGQTPYTYSIDNGATNQATGTFSGLAAATYQVLITDAFGCQVSGTETVGNNPGLTITTVTPTNASCHNVCDGELAATISGGTAPFTYAWTDAGGAAVGSNSANINGLCDGTYNLTVTDFNGCTASQNNNVITEPSAIDSSFTLSNFCAGTANAASSIATPGGSFSFNPNPGDGATIDAATGAITAGVGGTTYTVQYVATVGACSATAINTVQVYENPTYTPTLTDATCGNDNGAIVLTTTSGAAPFTYSIDGGASTQTNGNFTSLGQGTYNVLITDDNGCQVTGTENIVQHEAPTITTVTPTNASCHNVCDGELAATISGGTAPFTYTWTDAGGAAVGSNSANINSLCDGTYNLTVTDFNGCTASQNNNVITEPSAIDSSFALSNFCAGTANAASSIATPGGSFSFNPNPGDGATIDAATGAITAGIGGTTYTVQYVATVGACSATAINTVQVYENPTYTAASTDATCGNIDGAITLTTTSGAAPFTYSIDGGTSTQTNGNFTSLGQGTYNILITDDNGCQVTGTESVQEFGAPTITAITPTNASCHNVCDGELAATISGGTAPFTYAWTDAGGAAVGSNSANINGLCDGTYNLTVTDFNGCTVSQNNNVITEPSAIDSSFALSNFCAGTANAASSIATPGGSFSFNPNPGDGATIDAATGTITAGVGGTTYTVQYVATVGACSATATNTVQVYENPTYTPSITDATCGNDNGAIVLTTTAGAAPFTYSIDNGATSQTNGTFGALGDGTYNILITDDNGCQVTGTENIVQHGSPSIVSITPTNPSCFGVCDGSSVVAVTGGETPYSYAWIDANNNSVGNTASINNLCDGNYTITVSDFNGCTVSGTSTLTEPAAIDPSFNLTDYCENDANQATNVATPGGTFSFNPPVNDGATINGSSGTIVNGVGGTSYTVEYTATVGGCSENSTQNVSVHPLPKPNLIGDELIGCAPHSVNFGDSAQLPGSISCVWDFGDGTTVDNCNSSLAHTYSSPGLYSVSLTVTSQFGCVGQYAVTDYIQVTPHPIADFEATPPEVGVSNTEIHFNNQSEDASNYSWSFGDGSPLTTEENPIHTFPDDKGKTYTVTLIASNGNAVCNDTISQAIRVKEELIFYVPNTFTPDNDNYNETFQPVFTAGFDPYTYTLLIFDRWGEILFESHNTAVGWDGTYGGKIVQDGTYIWKITFKEAKDMSDKHHTYTGHVNVLR